MWQEHSECSRAENSTRYQNPVNCEGHNYHSVSNSNSSCEQGQQITSWLWRSYHSISTRHKGIMPSLAFQPGTLCHVHVCEQRVQPYSMTLFCEIIIAIISESKICQNRTRYRHQNVSCKNTLSSHVHMLACSVGVNQDKSGYDNNCFPTCPVGQVDEFSTCPSGKTSCPCQILKIKCFDKNRWYVCQIDFDGQKMW